MTKNASFVPGVPGLCRALCRVFHSCAGCAGSPTCARTRKNSASITPHKRTHARIYTRHTRHTRHMLDLYTYFSRVPGTRPGTPGTGTPTRAPNPLFFILKKKMEEKTRTRTIRCTPDNALEMQQMVKQWPELHALVQDLQAQGVFPGLRALTITLTGPEIFLSKGVGAVNDLNAPKRD
jgi:hypothetical protein